MKKTQTPIEQLQEGNLSILSSIVSPIIIDVPTVQETIKWTNQINNFPILKPEAMFIDQSPSSSQLQLQLQIQRESNGYYSSLLSSVFSSFSRKEEDSHHPPYPHRHQIFDCCSFEKRKGKNFQKSSIVPMNYSEDVMEVLDNYFYLGPH